MRSPASTRTSPRWRASCGESARRAHPHGDQDIHRHGAERRRRHRSGGMARSGRHHLGRRHHLHRHGQRRRRNPVSLRACAKTSRPEAHVHRFEHGRRAHRARLLRRARYVVPRSVDRGAVPPPDRHRDGGYRWRRCAKRRAFWRSARWRWAPRSIGWWMRASDYFEQVLRFLIMGNVRRGQLYPLVRRCRTRDAGPNAGARRAAAWHAHARAWLHRRRQRSGALRSGAAHARSGARSARARSGSRVQAAGRARVSAETRPARAALRRGVFDQSRPLGRDHRRQGDAHLRRQHSRERLGAVARRVHEAARVGDAHHCVRARPAGRAGRRGARRLSS